MKLLSIPYDYAEICKPCLKQTPKEFNKIYQLFDIIAIQGYLKV